MNSPISTVLFDLDGTLIDTAPDFHWVINQLLKEEGKPGVDFEFLRYFVSQGARAMVGAAFALEEGDPEFTRLHQRMLTIYESHLDVDSCLFDGMEASLAWLKERQIPWGIVTNKPELYSNPIVTGLGLTDCACLICPDHVQNRKPDPEALFLACQQLDKVPKQAIYVGDHIRDIEAGKRAGMITIAAAYGYLREGEQAEAWQADFQIDTAAELLPLLQSIDSDSTLSR